MTLPIIKQLFFEGATHGTEVFETLLNGQGFRLEWIQSFGFGADSTCPWYDQDTAEWVVLMRGDAVLCFEEGEVVLNAGQAVFIPVHQKHRVSSTSTDAVWLALHIGTGKNDKCE